MIWYNPADGSLHDDMDGAALALPTWPAGMVEATAEQINPPLTLAKAQAAKLANIGADFQAAANASVTDAGGAVWNGGFESAQAIYGAAQLAQAGGAATVEIFDASNIGHSLTIAQATAVAAAVGAAYQAAFAKYQGLKVQIAAATTAEAVQAI
ncbi:DUF4376 domain-containing protein, partial [Aquitalea magnusonii]|uniref:DUF4376 domain-containing protein n=1 Tax=Aquitalea magnusonii TaxID=332411 RepID=UPI00128F95F4